MQRKSRRRTADAGNVLQVNGREARTSGPSLKTPTGTAGYEEDRPAARMSSEAPRMAESTLGKIEHRR
jgi:hypothetical protein